ncbi:syntaxin binding protein 1 [Coemansia sp. RSA 1813]|nr:syntaxin binding protein 1 [Coemansia sp. RSA 1646]KAJ1772116.1 syntaxin binding protein 1 [Coemansia sp. RSA 1843]KAJ2088344.1 syntaxin binding protein 1 [Coemansia sp. RSA 986]KAJ2213318.1 syntaxin binding protein 1 [Coemansia sp. RSA 487]KAJ2568198.1 syntaxin binding protein 1 [Coemansia sp. RSA 1813]
MVVNLEENKRQEFLNALISVRPASRFKILVVDKRSLQILNKTLKLSEILEHDILRIEKIENNRKDEPDTEALYFLTPSKQSILRLINDFPSPQQHRPHPHLDARGRPTGAPPPGPPPGSSARKKPRYRCAHVYFTSELSSQLFKLVKGSGITSYIKALKEMCIEYDVHDSHIFLTKLLNYPMYRLYSPLLTGMFNDELEMISKKLTNVCGALKETPVVRYLLLDQDTYGDTKARPLAFLFHTEMDRIREALPQNAENKQQSELIIIDRSADPFAPILHEFTYEAMVYDLLKVDENNQVSYTAEMGDGSTQTKQLKLNDSDPIWEEFRFQHISDAQDGLLKKFNDLVGSNKSITEMRAGKKLNLSKMRDVVNRLPQFKDQMAVISAHITVMQDCMNEFNERFLNDLGMIQQNIAMGTTPDGAKYAAGDIDIADVLNNPDIKPKDKLRTLLIFFVSNPSLTEKERQKLAHMAKFSREAREAIKNMGMVFRWSHALDLLKQLKERPTKATKFGKWGFGAIGGSNAKEEESNKPYDLSRYAPAMKNVLEDCVTGKLSEELFPYVVPPERPRDSNPISNPSSLRNSGAARSAGASSQAADRTSSPASSMWTSIANSVGFNTQDARPASGSQDAGSAAPRQIKSLRSGRPTWQKRDSAPGMVGAASTAPSTGSGGALTSLSPGQPTSVSPPASSSSQGHRQPRIIIYVIGGVTFSEVRAAQEVARKYGREVLVGSTHVLSPSVYMREIAALSFEISDEHGRIISMKPSYFRLGYGGPPDFDPLSTYDENIDKPQPKATSNPNASAASDASGMSGSVGSGGSTNNYSRSSSREGNNGSGHRGHARSQSRGSSKNSGSSSSRYPDPNTMPSSSRPHGGDGQPRPIASQSSMRSAGGGGGRSMSEGLSNHSSSSRPNPQSARGERSASPAVHRGADYRQYDAERGYRAGYDEYRSQQRQQQQQPQAVHATSSSSSFGHSSRSGTPHEMQQQQRPAPRQLTKEEMFRAKFEQSQHEWSVQKLNAPNINPSAVSDMHKVSLNPGGGGRGRSGSTSSSSEKPRFLKRYL